METENKVTRRKNTYRESMKTRCNETHLRGWGIGASAAKENKRIAEENVKKVRTREQEMEELVKQGKAVKEIIPLTRGYKIHYRLL